MLQMNPWTANGMVVLVVPVQMKALHLDLLFRPPFPMGTVEISRRCRIEHVPKPSSQSILDHWQSDNPKIVNGHVFDGLK